MKISAIGKYRLIAFVVFITLIIVVAVLIFTRYLPFRYNSLMIYLMGLYAIIEGLLRLEGDSILKRQRLPIAILVIFLVSLLINYFLVLDLQLEYELLFVLGLVAIGFGIRIVDGHVKRKGIQSIAKK